MSIFQSFNDISVHFSKAIGTPIINEAGKKIGKLSDFFVDYEEVYPTVLAIQYKQNSQLFYIPWEFIKHFSFREVVLSTSTAIRRSRTYPKVINKKIITSFLAGQYSGETIEYPPVGKVVLDRQIVDTHGKKVVRVNDIEFIRAGRFLRVTHAAIGLRSLIRRLGYEPFIDFVIKKIKPNARYLGNEILINWKFVHAIPDRTVQKHVKLSLTNEDIKNIHPADLADILEDLDGHARDLIFSDLDPDLAAKTLSEVEQDVQTMLIKDETAEEAAKIIENMGTDEAADLLSELDTSKANEIISQIEDDEIQEEIQELLEYEDNTAGGLMSTEEFQISPSWTRSEIIKFIQENHEDLETVYDIYIVDENQKLIGTCGLRELLIQAEDLQIKEIMNTTDMKSLPPTTHWKNLATYMSKYNLINVPIINSENFLLGVVSVDDILPWLLKEKSK